MDKNAKERITWEHSPETDRFHETYTLGKLARIYKINKMEGWRATIWPSEEENAQVIGTFRTARAAMAEVEERVNVKTDRS